VRTRTFAERIRDWDDCVQEPLGLKWRQQVTTVTFAVTLFARAVGICSTCNQEKQVTRATRDDPSTPGKGGADRLACLHAGERPSALVARSYLWPVAVLRVALVNPHQT
jgi:hypothetical protein